MFYQYSIGLDIRHHKLNAVVLKSGIKGIQTVTHSAFTFDADLDPNAKVKRIAEVVSDLIKNHRLGAPELFVSIPRDLVIVREVFFPLAVKENLRRTLTYEMQKFVPLPVDDIYFDYTIVAEDKQRNEIRLLLVVVKKQDLDAYLTLPGYLGQAISGIETASSAVARYLGQHQQSANGGPVGFMGVERQGGEIALCRDGVLIFSKTVRPAPSEAAASHFSKTLKTVIQRDGQEKSPQDWYFYGPAQERDLARQVSELADVPLTGLDALSDDLPAADMAPAYGLAFRGLRPDKTGLNLLPAERRKKPNRLSHYTMLGLTLLAVLLCLGWGASHLLRHRLAVADIDKQLESLQADVIQVEKLSADITAMQQQVGQIVQLRQKQISCLAVLKELTGRVPAGAYVEELRFTPEGLQLTGIAESASGLLEILEASPLFKDVVFLSAITKTRESRERFRIGMAFE